MRPATICIDTMIEVHLLRHGIAEDVGPSGRDADRALTSEGRKKLRQVLQRAKKAGLKPDLVLSSPYKRAVGTAELAVEVLGCPYGVIETAVLTPGARPEQVWAEIRAHKQARRMVLAGHEPLFSQLAAYLLDSPSLNVDFKKGAMMRIDFEATGAAPRGVLKHFMTAATSI
jgi:phosphohistidine phosphatase